jgi:hypothetical protein
MKSTRRIIRAIATAALISGCALPATAADLQVHFAKREPGDMLPPENASCIPGRDGKAAPGKNKSPALFWSKGPAGTRSYALAMVDPTVPVDRSTFNREKTTIERDAPRMEFVHWLLANIPRSVTHLSEGADGDGLSNEGLPLKRTLHGMRGQNGAGDGSLKNGPHGGYTGACPPWNDGRVHQYDLTVYALDVAELNLPAVFTRADFLTAAKGHILASGTTQLYYTTNSRARK